MLYQTMQPLLESRNQFCRHELDCDFSSLMSIHLFLLKFQSCLKIPWSLQLGKNVTRWKWLNYNQLKPKNCSVANCPLFYYGKMKSHPNTLYNGKYEWKYRKLVWCYFCCYACKIIHLCTKDIFLHTVRWNKKAPAPVALVQIPHLELLSNVYLKIILIDNTI